MRFKPYPKGDFSWTPRKAAAVLRKQQRERDELPLFADVVAASQPSVEAVQARRAEQWAKSEKGMRQYRANKWRKVRARLASIDQPDRQAILVHWNQKALYPGDPSYLTYVLDQYARHGVSAVMS